MPGYICLWNIKPEQTGTNCAGFVCTNFVQIYVRTSSAMKSFLDSLVDILDKFKVWLYSPGNLWIHPTKISIVMKPFLSDC